MLALGSSEASAQTQFRVHVLIANKADYHPDFLNPWAIPHDRRNLITKPGLFTPFNIQMLTLGGQSSLFVPYIKTRPLDDRRWVLERAEEGSGPGKGRFAQLDFNGNLIQR